MKPPELSALIIAAAADVIESAVFDGIGARRTAQERAIAAAEALAELGLLADDYLPDGL